jgi:putative endonuclease
MSAGHLRRGRDAETFARAWLQARGLKLLYANFLCRFGELDLVMLDGKCLVIVEVRYRRSQQYGGAIATVTAPKRQRIGRATQLLLQRQPQLKRLALRFDVLALSGELADPNVDWRKHAFGFDAESAGSL